MIKRKEFRLWVSGLVVFIILLLSGCDIFNRRSDDDGGTMIIEKPWFAFIYSFELADPGEPCNYEIEVIVTQNGKTKTIPLTPKYITNFDNSGPGLIDFNKSFTITVNVTKLEGNCHPLEVKSYGPYTVTATEVKEEKVTRYQVRVKTGKLGNAWLWMGLEFTVVIKT